MTHLCHSEPWFASKVSRSGRRQKQFLASGTGGSSPVAPEDMAQIRSVAFRIPTLIVLRFGVSRREVCSHFTQKKL